ncbi:MAG: hypothetical protein AABY32_04555 [Nanoarchaeota archaeon]
MASNYEDYKGRQVRYNYRKSNNLLDCNEWWFLVVNQNREIEEIQSKIFNLFAPIKEGPTFIKGTSHGDDLRYRLINFESSNKVEDYKIKEIYKKVIRDSKLYNRDRENGLEIYLDEKFK